MTNSPFTVEKTNAIRQIQNLRQECDQILLDMKTFSPPSNGVYNPTFRLIATPMLYSVWERCFSMCHAISLRLIRDITPTAGDLSTNRKAIWLIGTPAYMSLVDQIRVYASHRKQKKGQFVILAEFIDAFDTWRASSVDSTVDTETLVMTYSNVNPDVVDLNAKAIGIYDFPRFRTLRKGKLHDLVGRRNGIGHGGLINPPTNDDFKELLDFTETIIADYSDIFIDWIQSEF